MAALAALGDASDHQRLRRWSEAPDHRRDALWALGSGGRIDDVDILLACLDDPVNAPVAADSLGCILGFAIAGPLSVASAAESLDAGPADDAPVPEPSAYDDLPAPHVANVRAWWQANARRFDPALRYLGGLPWNTATVATQLARTATWRRQGLRLALGPAGSTLDLRAWARRQRAWAPRMEHDSPAPLRCDAGG
jgi:hypothetical protein